MRYTIKRNNNVIATIRAKGSLTEKLFGEETLTLDFTLPNYLSFKIGDSIEVYGKTYYISQEPVVDKKSTREYIYNLVFNGEKYRLAEVQYFFYDENNELTMPEFSITATAEKMIELLVANANRTQTGWSVGNIDSTETKTVDFSDYNCLAALTRIADEFGVEFWIDSDKSIHLEERKQISGYTLEYGKNKGLKGITRNPYNESSLVTRLYARGANKNLPHNYRNGQKNLRMPVPFLEKNTDKYGIIEHTQNFEDIYPKRIGTVTQIYPDDPRKFTDNTLDFDLNEYNEYGNTIIQKGISAKVIFQTGDLAGYTLEVKEYGFDSATKTFTLLKNKDEKTFEIPSDTFRPQVGDKYIIIDISMPKTYVDNAEAELQLAAQDYLDKNSKQRFIYAVEPDPIYLKKINFNLQLGHTVHFKDADFNLDDNIRVISITRDINNPYDIQFEIAETATITQIVRNYIEKEKAQIAIKKQQKYNAEMARRSWLFAEEIKNNVFDNEGYFDTQKIKPLSIETGMLSVGSRMQQFSLPNVALNITDDNKRLHNTAGQMVHLTIDENDPRTWNLAENTTAQFSDNFNFIYIKADKIGSNATIVVTEQKIMFDSDPIFYFFLAGSVSSVINGVRRIKTNYGYTQITPSEITTGRIASPNGNNYIDLKQDGIEINAKVTFASDSPAIQQVVNSIEFIGQNLVKNPTKTETTEGWTNTPIETVNFNGSEVKALRLETAFNSIIYSDWFNVDPTRAYEVSVWYKKDVVAGRNYIGLSTQSGAVYRVDGNNGEMAQDGNFYFTHFTSDITGDWVKIKGYILPYSYAPMDTIGLSNNIGGVNNHARLLPTMKKIRLRILNYYNNGNNSKLWIVNPQCREVSPEVLGALSKSIQENTMVKNQVNAVAGQINNLGTMAWQNAVEKAMLGSTIVQGGYIKTELINASAIVSNGGGATSAELNNAINGIVLGGRNYLKNSKSGYSLFNNNSANWNLVQGEDNGVRWVSGTRKDNGKFFISTYWHLLNNLNVFTEDLTGQDSIQSIEVKPTHDMWIGLWENSKIFCPANVWTKIHNKPYNNSRFMGIYAIWNDDGSVPSSAKIYHRNWKLEKGNKPTDWTPAPEDLDAQFANIQQGIANMQTSLSDVKGKTDNFASIQGGLMMANLMSVGSSQANQNAFISGVTDAGGMSVRFGAGANYANKHNAPFRVLDNGKVYGSDMEITGGKIARFAINGNTLSGQGIADPYDFLELKSSGSFKSFNFSTSSQRESFVLINNGDSVLNGNQNNMLRLLGRDPNNYTQYNALSIKAEGQHATAINIEAGEICVEGENGYTGEYELSRTEQIIKDNYFERITKWETKNLIVKKGIITNISTNSGIITKRKK